MKRALCYQHCNFAILSHIFNDDTPISCHLLSSFHNFANRYSRILTKVSPVSPQGLLRKSPLTGGVEEKSHRRHFLAMTKLKIYFLKKALKRANISKFIECLLFSKPFTNSVPPKMYCIFCMTILSQALYLSPWLPLDKHFTIIRHRKPIC